MPVFYKKPFQSLFAHLGKPIAARFKGDPVFIGGCGRSGTTLLLSVLSAHRYLFCHPKELGIFNGSQDPESTKLKLKNLHRLYQSFVLNKVPEGATRWCEKSPNNILHLGRIDRFTNGEFKFIQIVRDGRDVVLSRHPSAPDKYWVEPERWIRDVSIGLEAAKDPRVHTIRYEDLIQKYDQTIHGICTFLEIELTDELMNWHQHARVIENRAYNGREVHPLSSSSIGKWKDPKYEDRVEQLIKDERAVALLKNYEY